MTEVDITSERAERLIDNLRKLLVWMGVAVFVLLTVVTVLEIQVQNRNHDIVVVKKASQRLEKTVNDAVVASRDARLASITARDALKAAIAASTNPKNPLSNARILRAFNTIDEIKVILEQMR